jgi:hypothetical protein
MPNNTSKYSVQTNGLTFNAATLQEAYKTARRSFGVKKLSLGEWFPLDLDGDSKVALQVWACKADQVKDTDGTQAIVIVKNY